MAEMGERSLLWLNNQTRTIYQVSTTLQSRFPETCFWSVIRPKKQQEKIQRQDLFLIHCVESLDHACEQIIKLTRNFFDMFRLTFQHKQQRAERRTSSASWKSEQSFSAGATNNGRSVVLETLSWCVTVQRSRFASSCAKRRLWSLSPTSSVSDLIFCCKFANHNCLFCSVWSTTVWTQAYA